ncbi:hypothetical protein [Micromonospora ureilytica]|uniref:hypothetical protein n=1 Tax=Micromonospora ureilytica TaxID=709868 RepID=UPI0040396794
MAAAIALARPSSERAYEPGWWAAAHARTYASAGAPWKGLLWAARPYRAAGSGGEPVMNELPRS